LSGLAAIILFQLPAWSQTTPSQKAQEEEYIQDPLEEPAPLQKPPETKPEPSKVEPAVIPLKPTQAPPVSYFDIHSGRFGKLEIDIDDAQFSHAAVDNMHILARDLNLQAGTVKLLQISVKGGHFKDLTFDQLTLETQGNLTFDKSQFLEHKVLQFSTPVEAQVQATVTQDSLNKFLSSPQTLERLSVTANKKVSSIASMFGANASNFGVSLKSASVSLLKSNRVKIETSASLGLGSIGVPLPLILDTKLGLEDGWIHVSDTHLIANGEEISPFLSQMLVKKINGMTEWPSKSDDIKFKFSDLKVSAGKQFVLKGTAILNRLRFGRINESGT